ncbi:cerebellin 14 [Danio aesculapii]|uniref:cerebellin 14 n=1 Tax=Danio aesculapii TaxID=1142201 RepID=UPI0024BF6D0B|nr:cerebellin 14 [Danio aesculapii]
MLITTVIMLSIWATAADDLLSPNINITEQLGKIQIMETRMESMEKEIERLKAEKAECRCQKDTGVYKHDIMTSQGRVNAAEDNVEELNSTEKERVKIAFSASLLSSHNIRYIGPYAEDTMIVYGKIFTNIGNAYNTTTGIFTAPVKGVYFFNLVLFTHDALSAGVKLLKNDDHVVGVTDNPPTGDKEDTASNSVSLLLEEGDQISVKLMEHRRIYTDGFKRNTFSGHLLFTM